MIAAMSANFTSNIYSFTPISANSSWSASAWTTTWPISGATYLPGPFTNPLTLTLEDLKEIAERTKKEISDLAKSTQVKFEQELCAIASRTFRKHIGYAQTFKYGYTEKYKHIFLIIIIDKVEYLIDLTSSFFNQAITDSVMEFSKVDIKTNPWWDADTFYTSESGLLARQRKDKWAPYQITLREAKKNKSKIYLTEIGESKLSENILKINPLDNESTIFLQKQSKGEDFNTTLAKLILHKNPEISALALEIAKLIVK